MANKDTIIEPAKIIQARGLEMNEPSGKRDLLSVPDSPTTQESFDEVNEQIDSFELVSTPSMTTES